MIQGSIFSLSVGNHSNSDAVEKPGCVRRNIRRLIGPVIKVVIAEEADVGNENSCVKVEPVVRVE